MAVHGMFSDRSARNDWSQKKHFVVMAELDRIELVADVDVSENRIYREIQQTFSSFPPILWPVKLGPLWRCTNTAQMAGRVTGLRDFRVQPEPAPLGSVSWYSSMHYKSVIQAF